jgi:hypothetical protein
LLNQSADYDEYMNKKACLLPALFSLPVLFVFAVSCKPRETEAAVPGPEAGLHPTALLETGENPLWFELSAEGPRLIDAPGNASLVPFVPWTAARHITGILPDKSGGLAMAVNRGGFLLTGTYVPELTALYSIEAPYWNDYTVISFFLFNEDPAVLLSRDDFFVEPSVPVPVSRVWSPAGNPAKGRLVEIKAGAFADFFPGDGWDIDALHPGNDGYWYYRAALKAGKMPRYHYFRTSSLAGKGEEIAVSRFRGAAGPETPDAAPPPLADILRAVFSRAVSDTGIAPGRISASLVSPEFKSSRVFSLSGASGAEDEEALLGFYRPGEIPRAVFIFKDGRGFIAENQAEDSAESSAKDSAVLVRDCVLSPLPEGFVYTGIGFSGNVIFASWEEQQDYNIGAAGFTAVRLKF